MVYRLNPDTKSPFPNTNPRRRANFAAQLGFNFSYFFIRERGLSVEGFRKAGLRICASDTELAPYPNAVRLPECMSRP